MTTHRELSPRLRAPGLAWLAPLALVLAGCGKREEPAPPPARPATVAAAAPALRYDPTPIGAPVGANDRPWVTNVALADLDRDGLQDVLYCEAKQNTVRWIRQAPRGTFTEHVIGTDTPAPAHVTVADVNGSGRLDVLVACMGQVMPNNDRLGSIVVLEQLGPGHFKRRVVAEKLARTTDVRAADFSARGDGRLDFVAGCFGYAQGETLWLENRGDWKFEARVVNSLSGCVHTPVADFDGDGRPDFAALISQEWEEVHWFRRPAGAASFTDAIAWGSTNEDYGSSGLDVADVNRDGRPDLIYTNGDGFDYAASGARDWHGIQWLENLGGGRFAYRRVGALPGAYAPNAADLDGDGDVDLVAVSGFADWAKPDAVSLMAWLNDGRQNFTPVVLAHRPIQLITAAVGDLDGDGVPEIVTGGFHAYPPWENMSNVTLWRRR